MTKNNRPKPSKGSRLETITKIMNKLFDLAITTATTVFTLGATVFFAKATGESAKSVGKAFMSILKK